MSIAPLALRRLALRIAVAVAPLCACAAVLGIDDGHPFPAGAEGGATGEDGGSREDSGGLIVGDGAPADVVAGDSSSGVGALPDGAPIPPGCDNITADPTTGVFVDGQSGQDVATCGGVAAPCRTVQQGIDQAHNSAATPNVYVADGTYTESLTLRAGVNVYGGFSPGATAWARECSQQTTVIVAPATTNVTVTAAAIAGSAKLSTLTIETKGAGDVQPSESIFGIVATGQSTILALAYVTVTASSGGAGVPGGQGDAGASPTSPCGSSAGDGGSGEAPGVKGPGGDAGWFAVTGYVATPGEMGGSGTAGANGTAGGADTCVGCVTCNGDITQCQVVTTTPSCGTPGQAGCGGAAGGGGAGGGGGGSSVALLAWDATVNLTMTVLQAGSGGNGGAGGGGGSSGVGSAGAAGMGTAVCNTGCSGVLGVTCNPGSPDAGHAGQAGGNGGDGTAGGAGGDGSGGDAFAYVEGGNASVVADAFTKTALSSGNPGTAPDGGNGAPGRAAAQGP